MTDCTEQDARWLQSRLARPDFGDPLARRYCVMEDAFVKETGRTAENFEAAYQYARDKGWVRAKGDNHDPR